MKPQRWKNVPIDTTTLTAEDLEMFGGIEELNDYEIITAKTEGETSKKRKVLKGDKVKKKKIKVDKTESLSCPDDETQEIDMSAWGSFHLHDSIIEGLKSQGFRTPTKIQELTIPAAAKGNQDILGAAETGSGKTLAFGIPIINKIISIKERRKQKKLDDGVSNVRPLYCLILTPTRELAIQIKKHLLALCKFTDIQICSVVGGMALEKQRRILKKCPEIVVATPGRLWELIEEGEPHMKKISNIRYLVIDETDRMVEKGHFAELSHILSLVHGTETKKRQTFVFSATLTMIHDAPNRLAFKKKKGNMQVKQKLDSLINLTGMNDPKVIDITKETAVAESLIETQIMCSNEDKDSYLYYFLSMHPGRTLVFCNSIDCVRRLRTVLLHLSCNVLPLHASMQQRQRLKNLDRFEQSCNGVLLATDVAARGLDIKGIEHVIHFQVPRTAETYVHRSGRTARAQNEGLSLMLIEPQDAVFYKRICKTLNRVQALPLFPVDYSILKLVKERVTVARSIDKLEHRVKRLTAQNRWFQNAAKEMDLEIDEDDRLLNDLGDSREQAEKARNIKAMKSQLKAMLSKPIVSKVFAGSYPTKSGKLVSSSIYDNLKAVNQVKRKTIVKV